MNSLPIAKELECESISFPLISTGVFGLPKEIALKVTRNAITKLLDDFDMVVYLVVFDHNSYAISKELHDDIK